MMAKETRTQHRATCPACFAQQAVRGGRMVAHGYKIPQGWHQQVGNCAGVHKMHFGTPEGRDYTASIAATLRKQAAELDAKTLETITVFERKRVSAGVFMTVPKENPTKYDREQALASAKYQARTMRQSAAEFEKLVAEWQPKEPVEVEVEKAAGPLMHFHSKRFRGKLCAGSYRGAMSGMTTTDKAAVTCEKCKARLAAWAERGEEV